MITILIINLLQYAFLCATQTTDAPPGCGIDVQNYVVAPEWEKLVSAGKNLTIFYKNPSIAYGHGHELVRTALVYLEEIEKLDKASDYNLFRSYDAIWNIYLCGGPLHLKNIPYDKFIEVYKWDSYDVDEYCTIIDDTRRIWDRLVEYLSLVEDSDMII